MPIIDAHQHFWNLAEVEYTWLVPEYGRLYNTFEAPDLAPQLRVAGVDKTVLVQSANSYEDTAYMLKLSDVTDWIGAVVGWVDLMIPEETKQRIKMYTKHPKFRGVSHLIHREPNPDWVIQPIAFDSLKIISDNNLVFEVVAAFPDHLKHVPTLAQKLPNLKIVIDHLGRPPIKTREMSPWAEQLREAAQSSPNVYAKISGLNTVADWETWSASDIKPYIDIAIEAFGADRIMYGSDWPICTLAGSYQTYWVEMGHVLEGRSNEEMKAILGGTAAKVYRI